MVQEFVLNEAGAPVRTCCGMPVCACDDDVLPLPPSVVENAGQDEDPDRKEDREVLVELTGDLSLYFDPAGEP